MTSTDSSQVVSFLLTTANGETIEHQYVLKPDDYMVDFTIKMNGANSLLYQNTLNFVWDAKATQSEKEIEWEMQQSQVAFVENNEYDFERIVKGKDDTKVFPKTVDWVAINQQFFVTSFIAKNKFASGDLKWEAPKDTSLHIIGKATAHLKLNVQGNDATIPLQLYYGPNDYKILKSYDNGMQNIVPLGSGVFDFIKYDSIYHLPFSIPFYGDHVSLFTILATVTSLLISLYGMSNMQDTGNPMMKYLPFIFPVVLLGVFNRMPAALTWYYTVSNVITLLIQFVIQTYIIDHEKILAKLQENKKRPVSKSKWQDKIDAMQNSNDKLKQMKAKNDARKK